MNKSFMHKNNLMLYRKKLLDGLEKDLCEHNFKLAKSYLEHIIKESFNCANAYKDEIILDKTR